MFAKSSPRGHTTYLLRPLKGAEVGGNSVALLRMFPRASWWCATALRPTAIPLRQRWRAGGIAFRSPTSYLTAHVTHHSLARPGSLTPLGVSVWFQSEFGLSREQTHHGGGRGLNFARARARSPFFHSFVVVLPSLHGRVNLQFAKDAQRPHASWAKKCAPNCSITLPIALPFENVCRLQCRHNSVHASRS